jgi:hypothetical protein
MAAPARVDFLADAADLYNVWATELGITVAFERLSHREQTAWIKVVDLAGDGALRTEPDPECANCLEPLVCVCCGVTSCPDCGEKSSLKCFDCWIDEWDLEFCTGASLCIGESR